MGVILLYTYSMVTFYFKVSLFHVLHVLTFKITINLANLHASNPNPS